MKNGLKFDDKWEKFCMYVIHKLFVEADADLSMSDEVLHLVPGDVLFCCSIHCAAMTSAPIASVAER